VGCVLTLGHVVFDFSDCCRARGGFKIDFSGVTWLVWVEPSEGFTFACGEGAFRIFHLAYNTIGGQTVAPV